MRPRPRTAGSPRQGSAGPARPSAIQQPHLRRMKPRTPLPAVAAPGEFGPARKLLRQQGDRPAGQGGYNLVARRLSRRSGRPRPGRTQITPGPRRRGRPRPAPRPGRIAGLRSTPGPLSVQAFHSRLAAPPAAVRHKDRQKAQRAPRRPSRRIDDRPPDNAPHWVRGRQLPRLCQVARHGSWSVCVVGEYVCSRV